MSNRIHAKSLVNSVEGWWVALRSRSKQINTNQHYAVIEPSNIGRTPRNICAWELIAPTPFYRDTFKIYQKYIGVCRNNVSTTIVKIKYVGNYAANSSPNFVKCLNPVPIQFKQNDWFKNLLMENYNHNE